jgi:AcrR family transcriptional regulator
MPVRAKRPARRIPQQPRARETVNAVLDAVARILRRDGIAAITTNRIAEVAGVSIGSVYQYFPSSAPWSTTPSPRSPTCCAA